jgi:hypothetical protein
MSITKNELNSYFDFQEKYFAFLHNKLGKLFRGEARKANGMIKIGGYHNEWEYLSSIEETYKFRNIALQCMKEKEIFLKIRYGSTYIKTKTNNSIFPKMKIIKYLSGKKYNSLSIGNNIYIWEVNNVEEIYKRIK